MVGFGGENSEMRLIHSTILAFALSPMSVSAAVLLDVGPQASAPPCYSDSPACDRSVSAPLHSGDAATELPDPAVAAIVGLAILGVALGQRRAGLPQVLS